ncbi:MAG: ABC transporter substrate-binding protein [Betaproteobacteria bacterium]|nr:MAG: ABC transporter substrate-binding protein [Betaproteobacteria bacterium]
MVNWPCHWLDHSPQSFARSSVAVFVRGLLLAPAVSLALSHPAAVAAAERTRPAHAIAMHGTPKYPPDFPHFDYINPDAPKGGALRLALQGTFDSFNPFIPKGNAGAGGSYESLLTSSADEPFTQYGLIAENIEVPRDRSWAIFTLRPQARWHDGRPITVDDVIWSLETLKTKGQPFFRFYYDGVASVEQISPRQVKFSFSDPGNRELPLIVGQLPILPKHYWESRDFESTTLEPPLGSGPYRVTDFEPGRYIVTERVTDYWGQDLPVNVGQNNFDRIRYDYYRDDTVIRQALKAGEIDFRLENQAKAWALDYDVPAVQRGWLNKEEIRHFSPTGMQAFVYNTRRELFGDRKVREALAYAFDFEWTNRNLFFGQYARTESYFSNSELASAGLPEGRELNILDRYRERIPDELFNQPYQAPSTDGSGWPRENLSRAFALLEEAGWVVRDMQLVNEDTGQGFSFEILLVSPAFERIVLPFVRNLRRLGIDARVRLVDQSQYINRIRSFDFDMIVSGWGASESPGNEQRGYWTSAAASSPAASNYAGVSDPVIDELVELLINAPDRVSLVARARALDRVLLFGYYVIPQWHLRMQRVLYWDKFSRPEVAPRNGTSIDYWWFDEAKAARLNKARNERPENANDDNAVSLNTALTVIIVLGAIAVVMFRHKIARHRRQRRRTK